MSCSRVPMLAAWFAAVALTALPGTAGAAWTSASLGSASTTEQGLNGSSQGRLSAGSRHLVFRTASRNLVPDSDRPPGRYRRGGLVRKDLSTGRLELVAAGTLYERSDEREVPGDSGATDPSLSTDGRYVAFTTTEALVAADTNGKNDVYVRDMSLPEGPAAYELASALSGGALPATYGASSNGAALNSFGSSFSADGRKVAFLVSGASDLPTGGPPSPEEDGQVLLRDLDANTTTLVNVRRDPTTGLATPAPAGGARAAPVLSGDASTVAWEDVRPRDQARFVGGEPETGLSDYLWRRIADGPQAARRLAPVGDPDDPACGSGGSVRPDDGPSTAPCDGFFGARAGTGTPVPASGPLALSADGYTAAFATVRAPRKIPVSVRTASGATPRPDLMLADMRPGMSRKQGTRELTRQDVPQGADSFQYGPVDALDMSADGKRVAFTNTSVRFTLSRPTLVGPTSSVASGSELYVIDLPSDRMELITRNFDGGKPSGSAFQPKLRPDGNVVSFASTASNLVRGDGNGQPDVFFANRVADTTRPATQVLPPTPPPEPLKPLARLRATARNSRSGHLVVTASVPGAGSVTAGVSRRRRTVGKASKRALRAGRVKISVKPASRYRRLLRRRGKLSVRVTVRWRPAAAGQRSLRRSFETEIKRPRRRR